MLMRGARGERRRRCFLKSSMLPADKHTLHPRVAAKVPGRSPAPTPVTVCARATNCALAPPALPGCLAYACAAGSVGHALPWCNAALSFSERAA